LHSEKTLAAHFCQRTAIHRFAATFAAASTDLVAARVSCGAFLKTVNFPSVRDAASTAAAQNRALMPKRDPHAM
jgi:hypothetical protein